MPTGTRGSSLLVIRSSGSVFVLDAGDEQLKIPATSGHETLEVYPLWEPKFLKIVCLK